MLNLSVKADGLREQLLSITVELEKSKLATEKVKLAQAVAADTESLAELKLALQRLPAFRDVCDSVSQNRRLWRAALADRLKVRDGAAEVRDGVAARLSSTSTIVVLCCLREDRIIFAGKDFISNNLALSMWARPSSRRDCGGSTPTTPSWTRCRASTSNTPSRSFSSASPSSTRCCTQSLAVSAGTVRLRARPRQLVASTNYGGRMADPTDRLLLSIYADGPQHESESDDNNNFSSFSSYIEYVEHTEFRTATTTRRSLNSNGTPKSWRTASRRQCYWRRCARSRTRARRQRMRRRPTPRSCSGAGA